MRNAGKTFGQIHAETGVPISTIKSTVKMASKRDNGKSLTRSGRPTKVSLRLERHIVRIINDTLKIPYRTLLRQNRLSISRTTIYRILKKHNVIKWRCKKRPFLTRKTAAIRFKYACKYKDKPKSFWRKVFFCNECSVEQGTGHAPEWCFRTPGASKWENKNLQTHRLGKGVRCMVWGGFSVQKGVSKLILLERDPTSKRNGYTARSYLKVMEYAIPKCLTKTMWFLQDNAPIHKAKIIQDFLNRKRVKILEHPPYSPDLNPDEYLWFPLKAKLQELAPHIELMNGNEDTIEAELRHWLPIAWEQLDKPDLKKLADSMPKRLQAVYEARGYQTMY